MAILVNMGKRGFVLKEGFLNPGGQVTVDSETAETLTKAYPNELKLIVTETAEGKTEVVKEVKPVVEPEVKEEVKEVEEVKPAKRGSRKKKTAK
jgi:hypothetical protein